MKTTKIKSQDLQVGYIISVTINGKQVSPKIQIVKEIPIDTNNPSYKPKGFVAFQTIQLED
jgi:hypothetical protein